MEHSEAQLVVGLDPFRFTEAGVVRDASVLSGKACGL
jgi:hypothetical protein